MSEQAASVQQTEGQSTAAVNVVDQSSAVSTVTKDDAVVTAPGSLIVANVGGRYRRYEKLEHVPAGAKTYTALSDLKSNSKEQLEVIYSFLNKHGGKKTFKDHKMALENVWYQFSLLPMTDPVTDPAPGQSEKAAKDKQKSDSKRAAAEEGGDKPKKTYQKKREANRYLIKPETDKSKEAVSKLAPQAKDCVAIIRADGKPEYSEDELKALVEKHAEKLRTRQDPWRIFQYYRAAMIAADVLIQK